MNGHSPEFLRLYEDVENDESFNPDGSRTQDEIELETEQRWLDNYTSNIDFYYTQLKENPKNQTTKQND
jgi:hypothetical protein